MLTIMIAAEESAGLQTLRYLSTTQNKIVCVLSSPDVSKTGASVRSAAIGFGYDALPASDVKNPALADRIRRENVDLFLNVHSLFKINGRVLAAPRIGSFNLHPGPLPRYAGLNNPSWAIANGETDYGVTVHWMEAGIDTGPIAFQQEIAIDPSETGLSLSLKCAKAGLVLIRQLVELADQSAASIPRLQNDVSYRKYYRRKDVPNGGIIDWARPAKSVEAFVRAFDYYPFASPWGAPVAMRGPDRIGIHKLVVTDRRADVPAGTVVDDNGLLVACADEWVRVTHVLQEGKSTPAIGVLCHGDTLRSVTFS